jgi:hypothetical protein
MTGSCPNYLDAPSHMLLAYLPESDSLTLFGHLSAGDRLNYKSNESLGKHAVAPRSGQQTGILDLKQSSLEPHADIGCEQYRFLCTSQL